MKKIFTLIFVLLLTAIQTFAQTNKDGYAFLAETPSFPSEATENAQTQFFNELIALKKAASELQAKISKENNDKGYNMTDADKMALGNNVASNMANMTPEQIQAMTANFQMVSEISTRISAFSTSSDSIYKAFITDYEAIRKLDSAYNDKCVGEGAGANASFCKEQKSKIKAESQKLLTKYYIGSSALWPAYLNSYKAFLKDKQIPSDEQSMKQSVAMAGLEGKIDTTPGLNEASDFFQLIIDKFDYCGILISHLNK